MLNGYCWFIVDINDDFVLFTGAAVKRVSGQSRENSESIVYIPNCFLYFFALFNPAFQSTALPYPE